MFRSKKKSKLQFSSIEERKLFYAIKNYIDSEITRKVNLHISRKQRMEDRSLPKIPQTVEPRIYNSIKNRNNRNNRNSRNNRNNRSNRRNQNNSRNNRNNRSNRRNQNNRRNGNNGFYSVVL